MKPIENLRRVVLVTSCLGGGGAERIVATMAAYWAQTGHEVHVVALRADEKGPTYSFPTTVRIHRLQLVMEHNPVFDHRHFRRLWRLRRLLLSLEPFAVVSFIDKLNVAVLLSLKGTGVPVIASGTSCPMEKPIRRGVGAPARGVRFIEGAWTVVSPTESMSDWFKAHYKGNYRTLRYPAHSEILSQNRGARFPVIFSAGKAGTRKGIRFAGLRLCWSFGAKSRMAARNRWRRAGTRCS